MFASLCIALTCCADGGSYALTLSTSYKQPDFFIQIPCHRSNKSSSLEATPRSCPLQIPRPPNKNTPVSLGLGTPTRRPLRIHTHISFPFPVSLCRSIFPPNKKKHAGSSINQLLSLACRSLEAVQCCIHTLIWRCLSCCCKEQVDLVYISSVTMLVLPYPAPQPPLTNSPEH